MSAKFVMTKSGDGEFFFSLKAENGERILTSEGYESKQSAVVGAEAVKSSAAQDARYERKESGSGESYFVLKAENGEPIARSEMYSSTSAMESGIDSAKKNAASAAIDDQS